MIALMEVQHALLDARIDRLTAHTLLYSLQLAMQLKISTFTGLSSRLQSVTTCPELESDLDLDRARGLRPSKDICSTCPEANSCLSPETCPRMPSSRPERSAVEGPASPPRITELSSNSLARCHPERSAKREVEGPFVSSPEATAPDLHPDLETSPTLAVETQNLKLETASVIAKIHGAASAREQKALRLRAITPRSAQGDTRTIRDKRQYKTRGKESGAIANPALKGGASHVPFLRDLASADG
jgi:hypothetical protein